jgi:hypothetical protein
MIKFNLYHPRAHHNVSFMNAPGRILKNDKFTFAVVIGILLCSLIYTSGYTLVVKDENEKFRNELRAIEQEMTVLLEILPTPDEESMQKKQKILRQVEKIRKDFYHNNISATSKQQLFTQLSGVKTQVGDLEKRVKTVVREHPEKAAASLEPVALEDTLLHGDRPGTGLSRAAAYIPPDERLLVRPAKKLSVYYFRIFSSDKKNRYHRTNSITIQLQLQGEPDALADPYLRIEIRDPDNYIISNGNERIRASTEYMASYIFEPGPGVQFKKGRYVIRIYSARNDFQQITFLMLV